MEHVYKKQQGIKRTKIFLIINSPFCNDGNGQEL